MIVAAIHGQLRHAVESIATELGMGKLAQSLRGTIIGRAASRRIDKAAGVYQQA